MNSEAQMQRRLIAPAAPPKIYLTGPITGVVALERGDWRDTLKSKIDPTVRLVNPVDGGAIRSRLYREAGATAMPAMQNFGALTIARNKEAIQSCDMLLANLLNSTTISLGSVGEIFWADAFKKPIVVVREPLDNPHDHLLLNQVATWIVFDLDAAINQVRTFFNLSSDEAGPANL